MFLRPTRTGFSFPPRLAALTGAFLFSTGGAAIKATTLNAWQVAGLRSLVAAIAIAFLLPASRRHWTWRVLAIGLLYALTLITFVLANKNTTAANAIFLQSAAPFYLLLTGPWLLREPIRRQDLATLLAIAAGMAMIVFAPAAGPAPLAPDPAFGNTMGVLSGVFYALTLTGLRWVAREGEVDRMAPTLAGNALTFLICAVPGWPLPAPAAGDVLAIGYLGLFQIALAYWCVTRALTGLPVLATTLLIMLEPALNPVWTWLMHGEAPGIWSVAGGTLILLACAWNALQKAD